MSQGTTLIELLISLLLLSIIFLSLDACLITSLNNAKINYYVSVAQQQLINIAEQLSLGNELTINNISKWNQQNQHVLPQGQGEIRGHFPHYQLSLSWGSAKSTFCQHNTIKKQGCLYAKM